jgi:phosphoribosylanthranilate isomerase
MTRVKLCGVRTPADVRAAVQAGADAVGINFYPPSPRYVPPAQAAALLAEVPALLEVVGVFAEQPLRQVCALAYQLGLRSVQYHGDLGQPLDVRPFACVPAFCVRGADDVTALRTYVTTATQAGVRPAAVLVDGYAPGQLGGTGQTAPWHLLVGLDLGVPLILAGGLTPENVADAIRLVRPFAVDVASGVESAPGIKDAGKMRAFVQAARGVRSGE